MKKHLLYIVLFFCLTQQIYSQEDGVIAFDIPVRNSLKFNKYIINPTFSFVREQNKYISFTNKREWVQFDDAPQTYLFSYSGRFRENMGVGVGVIQQDYGVLTTFGGVLNFAYNAIINRESNLTFGMNLGFYQSSINDGKVITNFPDPSLENIPTNSILTINPGINYGTGFFDFGLSVNNVVSYNLNTSKIIEDNLEQSVQAHIMYTGYVDSRGFFDESKFSGLLRSEFKKDNTVISGIMMLTVPKGIWGQVGYNTLYGASAGIGINVSKQIALEYNYEKAIGDLSSFGNSHDITLAYKFKNKNRYNYSGDDEEESLLSGVKSKRVVTKSNIPKVSQADRIAIAKAKEDARALALEKRKEKADTRLKMAEAAKAKREAKIQEAANKQIKDQRVANDKLEQENKAKELEKERNRLAEAEQVRLAEEARTKLEADAKTKAGEETIVADTNKKEEANIQIVEEEAIVFPFEKDDDIRKMNDLTKLTVDSKIKQAELLIKLREKVASKQKDLDDLKEENDLSEQGIFKAPKAFKSVTAENAALESLKSEIDNALKSQNDKISELENLYEERLKTVSDRNDATNLFYKKTIDELKSGQQNIMQSKEKLNATLEKIKVDTEFERKRRIKRAAYDSEEDRYVKDRAALKQITQFTTLSSVLLNEEDFDFGEELSNNIQIVKDVKNAESGYYLVIAVHSNVDKRDKFLTNAVSSGRSDIDFFYDVKTSKYYIYYEKFNEVEDAKNALKSKGKEPYNSKMSMVKIEN